MINVKNHGAIGDGVTDDSAAIQAALDTGQHVLIPTGDYLINSPLTFTRPGQMVSGDGRTQSRLIINPTFNLAAQGVLIFACGEEGPQLQDFGMAFAQPDTNSWNALINYPVAIYAVNTPRFTLSSFKITRAMNGIDMTGNSGGAFIEILEMSAFGTGITIDGSLDTVRINQFHFWCFDMTQSQTGIFFGVARALDVGRVDSLILHEFLNISSLGLNLRPGVTGDPWVYMSDSGFDTFNGIRMSAGFLQIANSYITLADSPTLRGVHQTGGILQFTNCYFASSQSLPFILMENMTGGSLQVDNSYFNCASSTQFSIGGNMTNNSVQVSNCKFQAQTVAFQLVGAASGTNKIHLANNIIETAQIPYNQPIIIVLGRNQVYMTGNRVNNGSGQFIVIEQDSPNWVSGNIAPGWTYTFPPAKVGFYSNNLQ